MAEETKSTVSNSIVSHDSVVFTSGDKLVDYEETQGVRPKLVQVSNKKIDFSWFTPLPAQRNIWRYRVDEFKASLREDQVIPGVIVACKYQGNCFIHENLHRPLEKGMYYVIDGQHKLKAVEELTNEGYYDITLSLQIFQTDSVEFMYRQFQKMNNEMKKSKADKAVIDCLFKGGGDFPKLQGRRNALDELVRVLSEQFPMHFSSIRMKNLGIKMSYHVIVNQLDRLVLDSSQIEKAYQHIIEFNNKLKELEEDRLCFILNSLRKPTRGNVTTNMINELFEVPERERFYLSLVPVSKWFHNNFM